MSPKGGRGEVEKDGHPTFPSGGDAPLPDRRECGRPGRPRPEAVSDKPRCYHRNTHIVLQDSTAALETSDNMNVVSYYPLLWANNKTL